MDLSTDTTINYASRATPTPTCEELITCMFSNTFSIGIWNSEIRGFMGDSVPLSLTQPLHTHDVKMMLSTPVRASSVMPIEQSMHQKPMHGSIPHFPPHPQHFSCSMRCSARLYTFSSW